MQHKGITWYDYLNNSNKNSLSRHYNLKDGLVVRREKERGNEYAWFRNHIDFFVKTRSYPQNFHEVVCGPRKAYFDFDKAQSLEELEKSVEEVCLVLLKLLPIQKKDLFLFTSLGDKKFSAHLVVNNYYYSSGRQVKQLFLLVLKEVSERVKEILDPAVYSTIQNFRLLGSSKWGEKRPKVHAKLFLEKEEVQYDFPDPDSYPMQILNISLLGCTNKCTLLPDLFKEEEKEQEDIEESEVKRIINFCRERMEEFPFRKREIIGDIISLERVRPSYCKNCKRVHEKENPYITARKIILIEGEEMENKEIFFHCRRGKTLYLGQLEEENIAKYEAAELIKRTI